MKETNLKIAQQDIEDALKTVEDIELMKMDHLKISLRKNSNL